MDERILKVEDVPLDKFSGDTPRQKLTKAATLADLVEEFALFAVAPFFVYGGLDRDPVQEWVNESEGDPVVSAITLPAPVFTGLDFDGSKRWNNVLLAVERTSWNSLLAFLSGIVMRDTPRKILYESFPHAVFAPDRLAQAKGLEGIRVPVTVFGVTGNRRKVIATFKADPISVVEIKAYRPDPAVVARAEKMFR